MLNISVYVNNDGTAFVYVYNKDCDVAIYVCIVYV